MLKEHIERLRVACPVCHQTFGWLEYPPKVNPAQYAKKKKHWYQITTPVRYCKRCKTKIINHNELKVRLYNAYGAFVGFSSARFTSKYIVTNELVYLVISFLVILVAVITVFYKMKLYSFKEWDPQHCDFRYPKFK